MLPLHEFIASSPSDMRPVERLLLYSMVRGLRPQRVLEIGAFKGGSAMIVARALHENGRGQAVGIDPMPQADFGALPLHGRYELLSGYSPAAITEAAKRAGGAFDFVIIDGLHTHHAVRDDILGVQPFLDTEATILLHDAFHYGVRKAIEHCALSIPGMMDCGLVCNTPSCETDPLIDPWITYCGLYMLRYRRRWVSVEEQLSAAYRSAPQLEPRFGSDLLDHNEWQCVDTPCARCLSLRDEFMSAREPRLVWAAHTPGVFRVQLGKRRRATPEEERAGPIAFIPFAVLRSLPEE